MKHQGIVVLQPQIVGHNINGNMTGGGVGMVRPIRQKDALFREEKVVFQPFLQLRVNLADGAIVRKRLKRHAAFLMKFLFGTQADRLRTGKEKGPFLEKQNAAGRIKIQIVEGSAENVCQLFLKGDAIQTEKFIVTFD